MIPRELETSKLSATTINEACAWFAEFRSEDVDGKTRECFMEWLRISPTHIRAYLEIAGAYAELGPAEVKALLDVEALIASARAEPLFIELPSVPTSLRPRSRSAPRVWSLAASVFVIAVAVGLWQYSARDTYRTQIGEQRSFTLTDGSRIDLNARSRIRIRMSESDRRIDLLDGQAMFHVAKDANRPFIVRADEATVRAVGTAFDINFGARATTVTVVEGVVAVSAPLTQPEKRAEAHGSRLPTPTFVSAGEQVKVSGSTTTSPQAVNVAAVTAWTAHKLLFEGTPLLDVVEQFNRYNKRQIVIDDRTLERFQVSGYYPTTDPGSLLNFLRTEPQIEVIERADSTHLALKP